MDLFDHLYRSDLIQYIRQRSKQLDIEEINHWRHFSDHFNLWDSVDSRRIQA